MAARSALSGRGADCPGRSGGMVAGRRSVRSRRDRRRPLGLPAGTGPAVDRRAQLEALGDVPRAGCERVVSGHLVSVGQHGQQQAAEDGAVLHPVAVPELAFLRIEEPVLEDPRGRDAVHRGVVVEMRLGAVVDGLHPRPSPIQPVRELRVLRGCEVGRGGISRPSGGSEGKQCHAGGSKERGVHVDS